MLRKTSTCPRVESRYGAGHLNALGTRGRIAFWTAQCGGVYETLQLYEALLRDQIRVLGADHPDTLTTRNNIASWTGSAATHARH